MRRTGDTSVGGAARRRAMGRKGREMGSERAPTRGNARRGGLSETAQWCSGTHAERTALSWGCGLSESLGVEGARCRGAAQRQQDEGCAGRWSGRWMAGIDHLRAHVWSLLAAHVVAVHGHLHRPDETGGTARPDAQVPYATILQRCCHAFSPA